MNYRYLSEVVNDRSPTTYMLERLFWAIQYLFLGTYYFKTRVWVIEQIEHIADPRERLEALETLNRIRGRKVDRYLLVWAVFLVLAAFFAPAWLLWRIGVYRIAELAQSAVNMNIFDALRIGENQAKYVSLKERTLLISLWNFIEVWFCFGMIYQAFLCLLAKQSGTLDVWDAYYFSAITQLTIGYGDVAPTSWLRLVAPTQGFVAFLFAVVVLSRFVSLLPAVDSVPHK